MVQTQQTLEAVLDSANTILSRLLKRGVILSAIGKGLLASEEREYTILESMETLIRVLAQQAKAHSGFSSEIEQINAEITEAVKAVHNHDVPETIRHLTTAKAGVLELREKLLQPVG